MRWERVKVKHKVQELVEGKKSPGQKGDTAGPGKKWGHTANTVKNGRFLYIFGGYGKDDCQTQDVYVFDSVKQTWSKPNIKGLPPPPRDSHTSVALGTNLYVFGGTDGSRPLRDLHVLDTVSSTWTVPQTVGDAPCAREGHSAAVIGTRMYIFGGCGKLTDDSDDSYFNDLYFLETSNMTWRKVITTGSHPAPRDSHSMSSWNNNLIVLGGEDAANSFLSDIYILDTGNYRWKELKTWGQKFIPRAGHTTVALRKHLFVFAGFTDDRKIFDDLHVLNVESGIWTKATTTGVGPSPRFSLAGDVVDSDRGILLFIGGCNENLEALDDMYYLDTEMRAEPEPEPKREKLSLRMELKRKRQGGEVTSGQDDNSAPLSIAGGPSMHGEYEVVPVAERLFEAKITDVFHYGFTIEATIDNKPLRGLLFSYKPGFAHAAHNYVSRKKAAEEAALNRVREQRRQERKQARIAKVQAKRAEIAATASQAPREPIPALHTVDAAPGFPILSPEQYRIYLQQMLGNVGALIPPHSKPPSLPVPPQASVPVPAPPIVEVTIQVPPPPESSISTTPGVPEGVQTLAEDRVTKE